MYHVVNGPELQKEERHQSLTLSCSAGVKELGNGMSYPVLCLPSGSASCLKGVGLTTKHEMEGGSREYGEFKEKNEASQNQMAKFEGTRYRSL